MILNIINRFKSRRYSNGWSKEIRKRIRKRQQRQQRQQRQERRSKEKNWQKAFRWRALVASDQTRKISDLRQDNIFGGDFPIFNSHKGARDYKLLFERHLERRSDASEARSKANHRRLKNPFQSIRVGGRWKRTYRSGRKSAQGSSRSYQGSYLGREDEFGAGEERLLGQQDRRPPHHPDEGDRQGRQCQNQADPCSQRNGHRRGSHAQEDVADGRSQRCLHQFEGNDQDQRQYSQGHLRRFKCHLLLLVSRHVGQKCGQRSPFRRAHQMAQHRRNQIMKMILYSSTILFTSWAMTILLVILLSYYIILYILLSFII